MTPTTLIAPWMCRWKACAPAQRLAAGAVVLAGAGLLAWAVLLWPRWRADPDLSHGFFALPLVVMLWRRASAEAGPRLGQGAHLAGVIGGASALAGATVLATMYVAAVGWSEPISLFAVSLVAGVAAGLAAWVAAGPAVRWVAAGWAVMLIVPVVALSAPLPPGSYARLTLGLQEGVTVAVVETLRLFGVPAMRVGNVIHLGATSVGVEEACSGVRSLVSCVLAGLVMSGLLLRSWWRRLLLIATAAPLALATNYLRSLTLTLLARNGVDISGAWHDWLGLGVLGVTTGLLGWLAFSLEQPPAGGNRCAERERGGRMAGGAALAGLSLAAGWLVLVAVRTAPPERGVDEVPILDAWVPATASGWTVTTRGDLQRFSGVLQTDALLERSYTRRTTDGRLEEVTLYVAYWAPGASTVGAVASHTPDACWPGAGWTALPERTARRDLVREGGDGLAGAEQRGFAYGPEERWVWYWHLAAGRPVRPFEPRSWRELMARFWREGVPRPSSQVFVRLSSNLTWEQLALDTLSVDLAEGLVAAGVPDVAKAASAGLRD